MSSCYICRRTAPDGHHLCPLCAGELRSWLAELPRQALLLEDFVAPTGQPSQGRIGGTGRAHSPAPVDLTVLNLLLPGRYDPAPGTDDHGEPPIAATLAAWAGHIAYHYPSVDWHPDRPTGQTVYVLPCEHAAPRHGHTITSWCAWLTAYLPYTLTLPIAADLHRGLGDLITRIRDLTHTRPQRRRQAAPCPACQAYRLIAVDGREHITCGACGHHLTRPDYDQHATDFLHSLDKDHNAMSH